MNIMFHNPSTLFLKGIGEVKDATGETVTLLNHALPRTIIDEEFHSLYEEIPSLGICPDGGGL